MIVIDSSVVANLLLDLQPHADRAADLFREHAGTVNAPHLLDVEVGQVLRRYARHGELPPNRLSRAVQRLSELPIRRHGHELLLPRALQLRDNITVYDAVFVALAEALGAALATSDAPLAKSPGHHAEMWLV